MLASEIGNVYDVFMKIREIDANVSILKSSVKSLSVQINAKGQGTSAAEAVVSSLLNFYANKRSTLMAGLIAQGYTDG